VEILKALDSGTSTRKVAEDFQVSKETVQVYKVKRNEILKEAGEKNILKI